VNPSIPYQLLADGVLSVHVAIVLFVIGGLVLVVVGNRWHWRWVNALWFRLMHLAAIVVVAAQAWLGMVCPLTTLEMWLRGKARLTTYSGSFIEYWMQRLLYFEAPDEVFTLAYTVFGLATVAVWWRFPPELRRRPK